MQPRLPPGWRACLPLPSASSLSPLATPVSPGRLHEAPGSCAGVRIPDPVYGPTFSCPEKHGRTRRRMHARSRCPPHPTPCVCPPPRVERLHVNARAPSTLPRGGADCRGSLYCQPLPGGPSAPVSARGRPCWWPQRAERLGPRRATSAHTCASAQPHADSRGTGQGPARWRLAGCCLGNHVLVMGFSHLVLPATHAVSLHPLELLPPALLSHPSNHRGGRKLPPFRQVKVCSLSIIFD